MCFGCDDIIGQCIPLVDYSVAEEHVPLRYLGELFADTMLTSSCVARRPIVVPTVINIEFIANTLKIFFDLIFYIC